MVPLALADASATLGPGAPGDGFSPPELSGLILWTRSDVVTVSGGLVTAWPDLSGSGNPFTAVVGKEPAYVSSDARFNNLPAVQNGDGTKQLISPTMSYGAHTTFMPVVVPSATSFEFLWTRIHTSPTVVSSYLSGSINNTIIQGPPGDNTAAHSSTWNLSSNWVVGSVARSLCVRFDGTHAGHTLAINGVVQTMTAGVGTADPGTAPVVLPLYLMSNSLNVGSAAGTCPELIVYNRALSSAEMTLVEGYLNARYKMY